MKGKKHKSKKYEQYYGEPYRIEKWRKRAKKLLKKGVK